MTDEEAAETYLNTPGKVLKWKETYLAGVEHGRPKWISVKERLPEKDTKERVVILEKYDDGDSECRVETWYYNRWEHLPPDTNYDDHHKCEITHWMPIPELDGEK